MHRAVTALLAVALTLGCGAQEASPQLETQTPIDTRLPATNRPTTDPTTEPPTTEPGASPTPPTSPPASGPPTPLPSAEPVAPLPAPLLDSSEELLQQMYERAQAEQVVVSMLDQLGIGLYQPDGTAIRRGSEATNRDLYLFEPEARGLVDMLKASDDEQRLVPFRDFHASLAQLGFAGSAEDLAEAYAGAYEEEFETLMARLVFSLGGVDVETDLPPLQVWLMLLDGFVPPNGTGAAIASTNAESPLTAQIGTGWGVARDEVQAQMQLPLQADPLVMVHVLSIANGASVKVAATPTQAHEGHGSSGTPVTVTATVHAIASTFISPFSLQPLIPINPLAGGNLPVRWQLPPELAQHGSVEMPPTTTTDVVGRTSFTYSPQQEDANGEGYLARESMTLVAWVSAEQLISQAYGLAWLGGMVGGREIPGVGRLEVEWHEPAAMRISLVDTYDVTLGLILGEGHAEGRDTFEGILALQEDGTWRGVVNGSATGSMETEFLGESCASSWSTTQLLEIVGADAPTAIDGDFYFRFYPVTAPSGSLGTGECPPSLSSYEGVDYAPYNDVITQAADNQGLVITLPEPPGGTRDYPAHLEGIGDVNWSVTIEFLD